eukprot:3260006-Rhodomonas_salina.1
MGSLYALLGQEGKKWRCFLPPLQFACREAHLPTDLALGQVQTADNFFADYDTSIKATRDALYRAQERLYRNLLS